MKGRKNINMNVSIKMKCKYIVGTASLYIMYKNT